MQTVPYLDQTGLHYAGQRHFYSDDFDYGLVELGKRIFIRGKPRFQDDVQQLALWMFDGGRRHDTAGDTCGRITILIRGVGIDGAKGRHIFHGDYLVFP